MPATRCGGPPLRFRQPESGSSNVRSYDEIKREQRCIERGEPSCLRALRGRISSAMRKLFLVAAGLLVVHAALLFAGGRSNLAEGRAGATKVGIVLDVGGRGDKSFNDGAYAGADSAIKVLHPNIR